MNNIESLASRALVESKNNNINVSNSYLIQLYEEVQKSSSQLLRLSDYNSVGLAYLLMLEQEITLNTDVLQCITDNAYYCISKSISQNPNNINYRKNRLIVFYLGETHIKPTIIDALKIPTADFLNPTYGLTNIRCRDAMHKMQIVDIQAFPALTSVPYFKELKTKFDEMVSYSHFKPDITYTEIVKSGLEHHNKLQNYLENIYKQY